MTRVRELSHIATAVRLLDRMGTLLDEAFEDLARQQRDHADTEKDKLGVTLGGSRRDRDEYLRRAHSDIAALDRAAAQADAAGNPHLAESHRIRAATIRDVFIPTVTDTGSITESHGEVATQFLDFDAIGALHGGLSRARRKAGPPVCVHGGRIRSPSARSDSSPALSRPRSSRRRSPTLAPSYLGWSRSSPGRCSTTSSSRVCASCLLVCS